MISFSFIHLDQIFILFSVTEWKKFKKKKNDQKMHV